MSPEERRLHKKQEIMDIVQAELDFNGAHYQDDRESREKTFLDIHQSSVVESGVMKEDELRRLKKLDDLNKASFGTNTQAMQEKISEELFEKENKRIERRHRTSIAKMFFENDPNEMIREFKKIYKLELEENPERYTIKKT